MRAAIAIIAICGAADVAAQPSSPAEARRRAGEHFRKGQAAQTAANYREAIAEYEQAHELVPHPNTLFNIAFCYEQLGEWAAAADYYERYLADPGAQDAATVQTKIDSLRDRARAAAPPPADDRPASVEEVPREPIGPVEPPPTEQPPPVTALPRSRVHVGLSYGVGFGDAPTERYLGYAGIHVADQIELDGIVGKFGKNDLAIGVQAKYLLERLGPIAPFGRGAITIGWAREDASSTAKSKFPLGFEAGGGILLGARSRFELAAVVRWTRGGFDMDSTVVDSYINDTFAFAIDLGFVFDLPKVTRAAGP